LCKKERDQAKEREIDVCERDPYVREEEERDNDIRD
jgi:hypothetical protein